MVRGQDDEDSGGDDDISGDEIDPSGVCTRMHACGEREIVAGEEKVQHEKKKKKSQKQSADGLENEFFNLDEMDAFLDEQVCKGRAFAARLSSLCRMKQKEWKMRMRMRMRKKSITLTILVVNQREKRFVEPPVHWQVTKAGLFQGGAHYNDFFEVPDPEADEEEDEEDLEEDEEDEEEDEVDITRGLMKGKDSDLARGNNPFAAHDDDEEEVTATAVTCHLA